MNSARSSPKPKRSSPRAKHPRFSVRPFSLKRKDEKQMALPQVRVVSEDLGQNSHVTLLR